MPETPRGPKMYVNAARTKVVPADSPEAAYMYHERDVRALGLDPTKTQVAKAEAIEETQAAVAPAQPEEEKAQEPAANKARRGAEDK